MLVTGYWILDVGYRSLITDHHPLVLPSSPYSLLPTGYWFLIMSRPDFRLTLFIFVPSVVLLPHEGGAP